MANVPRHATLLVDFVNTLDVETGVDRLTSPQQLLRWLDESGLLDGECPEITTDIPSDAGNVPGANESDLGMALRLREFLRAVMLDHHGDGADAAAIAQDLEGLCAALPLRVSLRSGSPSLAPGVPGMRGGLSRIVAALVDSNADGTWQRLKVCPEETCLAAFLDTSKNRSRSWCSMRVCGNRRKTRAYRARRRTDGSNHPDRRNAAEAAWEATSTTSTPGGSHLSEDETTEGAAR